MDDMAYGGNEFDTPVLEGEIKHESFIGIQHMRRKRWMRRRVG